MKPVSRKISVAASMPEDAIKVMVTM
jgi:hypothetical protein